MKNVVFAGIVLGLSTWAISLRSEPAADLASWKIEGPVSMDAAKAGPDGKPSIKMVPNSKAVLNLRAEDGSGKLTLYVYDDETVAAPDQKKTVGPRWGCIQKDGRVLVGGIMYAHFFQPNGSLAIIDTDSTQKGSWGSPKFAGAREKAGWVKWEFAYDPDKGVTISIDGKPVAQKYFDWNASQATGFNGIVLYGDATNGPSPQTVWIGGIDYTLGPPMTAKPGGVAATVAATAAAANYPNITAPPPLADTAGSSVPATAQAATPEVVPGATLAEDLKTAKVVPTPGYLAHHPRLLFSASDRAALQQKAKENPELWNAVLASTGMLKQVPSPELITSGAKYYFIRDVESAALAWFVTGDAQYATDATKWMVAHCQMPVWGTGFNDNHDLQASWYLYYMSIGYDTLYSQMSDADRKTIRDGLAAHAKVLYDAFDPATLHDGKASYDQNHTYNPAVALTAAALVLYGNVPEAADWLNRAHAVMARSRYVLNEDGYYYEGFGYWQYALHWHERYADMISRATGEQLLDLPALRDNWMFGLYLSLPEPTGGFDVGDSNMWKGGTRSGINVSNTAFLWGQAVAHQSGESKLVADLYGKRHVDKDDPASVFLWYTSGVKPADLDAIKPYHYFPDVDVVSWRSSWKPDATCYLYRGGPPLGHSALAKLDQLKDWAMNTGHVHADIGSFYIYAKNAFLATTTGYTAEKWTRDQNTILIDGKGQGMDGEYHDAVGLPYKDFDGARIDRTHLDTSYGFVSGEIGSAYSHLVPGVKLRPSLLMTERWMLAIDDMSAEQEHKLTWICHADAAFQADGTAFVARLPEAGLGVVPLSTEALTPAMEPSTVFAGNKPGVGHLDQHGFQLTLTQAQPAKSARLINLLVPLGKDEKLPSVQVVKQDKDSLELSVKWPDGKTEKATLNLVWQSSTGATGPANITLP